MILKPEVDLKTLYYFTVLAEVKHFGLAAKTIGIEQPPLSLQIKKLEEKLGGKLFDRSTKRIALTETGQILLPEAIKLLASSQVLIQNIRKINRGEAGVLKIGFTSSTIFCGIPELIQQYKQLHPGVEFVLRELSPAAQLSELANNTLDVGFIREPIKVEGIQSKLLQTENFVAALASNHRLAAKNKLQIKELAAEPFILFPASVAPNLYHKIERIFKEAPFEPHIVQEANEWQTIVNLVESNIGVSICPSSFQKLKIGQIKYLPLTDVKIQTGVSVCFSSDTNSKLTLGFLSLIHSK